MMLSRRDTHPVAALDLPVRFVIAYVVGAPCRFFIPAYSNASNGERASSRWTASPGRGLWSVTKCPSGSFPHLSISHLLRTYTSAGGRKSRAGFHWLRPSRGTDFPLCHCGRVVGQAFQPVPAADWKVRPTGLPRKSCRDTGPYRVYRTATCAKRQ